MSARFDLEHKLWAFLKSGNYLEKKFILACSGGADSVALVRAMAAVRPADKLVVAYIHHGEGNSPYRNDAETFVEDIAQKLGLTFDTRKQSGPTLKSERELRDVRRRFLEEIRQIRKADFIMTAHHRRDLAETRILRLLRGTGPQGLQAILPQRGVWVRPFLQTSPGELRSYLKVLDQVFLEDPSNQDVSSMRNWLRHVWFPELADRYPGGVETLGRSLEDLAEALRPVRALKKPQINRGTWEIASYPEKLRLIAESLRLAGQNNMTRGQLKEIERRLDNEKKEYSFVLGGCLWAVSAHQIRTTRQG